MANKETRSAVLPTRSVSSRRTDALMENLLVTRKALGH